MKQLTFEEMRAECVRHYVERGYTPAHAEQYISKEESEILRIYEHIQKAERIRTKKVPCSVAGLNTFQIVLIEDDEEIPASNV